MITAYVVLRGGVAWLDRETREVVEFMTEDSCGGWTTHGPPCGGCTSCMLAQTSDEFVVEHYPDVVLPIE